MNLSDIKSCLQGIYPSSFYTCSLDGIPNGNFISHVHFVDENHLAISGQFLNKSKKNLEVNPLASLVVIDPETICEFVVVIKWKGSQTKGVAFDTINERIEAIDSMLGGMGNFKLQTIELFEVVSVEVPKEYEHILGRKKKPAPFSLQNLQKAIGLIQQAKNLEDLYETILSSLESAFGFRHSVLLIPEPGKDHLITISSRGYADAGAGSEVKIGEGIAGKVAQLKRPLAFMGLKREVIYAGISLASAIEFPSLPNALSQIAIPLLSRNELLGVLQVESIHNFDFKESDEEFLMTFGSVVAIAIENFQLQHDQEIMNESPKKSIETPASTLHVAYYHKDECILIDGEYLIRSLPAKILLKILKAYQNGQSEFTNRELRLDPMLQLPEFKDNLETRLILLRKRLEQRCPAIHLVSSGRGRFNLSVEAEFRIEEL